LRRWMLIAVSLMGLTIASWGIGSMFGEILDLARALDLPPLPVVIHMMAGMVVGAHWIEDHHERHNSIVIVLRDSFDDLFRGIP